MKRNEKPQHPKVRSAVAVAAHFQTGAGSHGGGKRQKARRDRQESRRALKRGDY